MVTLTNFVYCADSQLSSDLNAINALNVLCALKSDCLPGAITFSVVFSLLGVDNEKENKIKLVFQQDFGTKEILFNSGEITIPKVKKEEINDKNLTSINLRFEFKNILFKESGLYSTKIYLNDELLGERLITVEGGKRI